MGKYKLHEVVGRGGMGVVYRGEHVYIGKEVAVKILHDGYGGREESIKRFLREARAASQINHPNIVNVTDFGKSSDGTVFFVMEFLEGHPLDALLQREHKLDLLRAITIMNQLAGAVGAAHAKGIVHRDLKPENVMLIAREGRRELVRRIDDDGGARMVTERETTFDFVKILDFGVAKVRDPDVAEGRVTQQGVVFGTPEYMAPETARIGVSDPRTDIYALGVMFYEMLTGSVPFTGETPVDVMMKVVAEPVIPPRQRAPSLEITEEAERLIMKALSKNPAHRHQSMEELYDALQSCYGTVRYRRSLEAPVTRNNSAVPLQRIKRAASGTIVTGQIETPTVSVSVTQPILLTRRKDRKRTLPMDIGINEDSPAPMPTPTEGHPTAEIDAGDEPASADSGQPSDTGTPPNDDDWLDATTTKVDRSRR